MRDTFESTAEADRAARARRRSKKTANLVLGLANAMQVNLTATSAARRILDLFDGSE